MRGELFSPQQIEVLDRLFDRQPPCPIQSNSDLYASPDSGKVRASRRCWAEADFFSSRQDCVHKDAIYTYINIYEDIFYIYLCIYRYIYIISSSATVHLIGQIYYLLFTTRLP